METSAAAARVARHPSKETPERNASALSAGARIPVGNRSMGPGAIAIRRIGRPRQLYTGPTRCDYVEIGGRGE